MASKNEKAQTPKAIRNRQMMIAIFAIVGFVMVLVLGMYLSDPNKGKPSQLEQNQIKARTEAMKNYKSKPSATVDAQETWITKSDARLMELETKNRQLHEQMDQMLENLKKQEEQYQKELAQIKNNEAEGRALAQGKLGMPPAPTVYPEAQKTPTRSTPKLTDTLPPPPANLNSNGNPVEVMQVVSVSGNKKNRNEKILKNIRSYLPLGSVTKAVVISGVDAPTGGAGQANPHPVLLRIKDHGFLPNYARSYIKDCHVIGAATGNISSERVEIQLKNMSCVLHDGDVIEIALEGWVAGEDGKGGFRGRVVEKQGQFIARALMAGSFGGIGNAVSQSYQQTATSPLGSVQSVDPNKIVQNGFGQGVGTTFEKLGDYWMKRLDETYPVIELGVGRIGDVILTTGADFEKDIMGNTHGPN